MRMLAFGHPQGESLGVEEAIGVGTCGEAVRPLARARLNRSPPLKPLRDNASMRWCRCTKHRRAAKVAAIYLGSLFSQVDCENASEFERNASKVAL